MAKFIDGLYANPNEISSFVIPSGLCGIQLMTYMLSESFKEPEAESEGNDGQGG